MTSSPPLLAELRRRIAVEPGDVGVALRAVQREANLVADDAVLARWDREASAQLRGAGPLEGLLELPDVTDVLVNAPAEIWLDRGRGMERADVAFASEAEVRSLACRLATAAGRRLDDASPFVDAHLPDGTRLHAVLPPLAEHTTLSLRVLARRRLDFAALLAAGTVSREIAPLLRAVVAARLAFLISGGTGTGKTTVLAALLGLVPADQRVVVIEDAAELSIDHPHVVRLLARTANVEGAGVVTLRDLVRLSLRMRPDRVVVGEFRGAEIVELLAALNTGHSGGGATVHANGIDELPARLEALGSLGGLDRAAVAGQAAAALDVVLHLERMAGGRRELTAIGVFHRSRAEWGPLEVHTVWTRRSGFLDGASEIESMLRSRGVRSEPAATA